MRSRRVLGTVALVLSIPSAASAGGTGGVGATPGVLGGGNGGLGSGRPSVQPAPSSGRPYVAPSPYDVNRTQTIPRAQPPPRPDAAPAARPGANAGPQAGRSADFVRTVRGKDGVDRTTYRITDRNGEVTTGTIVKGGDRSATASMTQNERTGQTRSHQSDGRVTVQRNMDRNTGESRSVRSERVADGRVSGAISTQNAKTGVTYNGTSVTHNGKLVSSTGSYRDPARGVSTDASTRVNPNTGVLSIQSTTTHEGKTATTQTTHDPRTQSGTVVGYDHDTKERTQHTY